ncbi:prophage cp4-57 regulatory [Marinobacter lipolyticus SM19]|uniref:Prophage cp4-57 regulatory n=1 Tax=Marinobacter lipolyticus SM19 TaxID=1318628 RepID=R8B3A1_9GAMM|nr:hypothetical protein [Marinobacter lipolyticus]EON93067.1 prophage cp4-57 regulatory [Marinobacter lipolyticus SM19]
MNREYDFTLKFSVPPDLAQDQIESSLFQAGCEDAIIGLGQKGRLALNFTREAESAEQAILSAIQDVQRAVPEARLVEAGPDFVGISDMASLLKFSRQNMRKLIQTHLASFPLPVHEGASAIWHLFDVLAWFSEVQKRAIPTDLMDVAHVSMGVNLTREAGRIDQQLQAQLSQHSAIV